MKRFVAIKTSLFLSVLFLLIYGGSNWIAAHRVHVRTLFFAWERLIPFVPVMIIPYMSIDLFFVDAPFVCGNEDKRRLFARRVTFAIVTSGICFLLFPLRFAFDHPQVSGWLAPVFAAFRAADQPFNLVPSLHITLLTILAGVYLDRARGWFQFAVKIWFALIALSTLLTYQHHVADLLGGFLLGAFCFYLFRETENRLPVVKNVRIGLFHAAGSMLLVATAIGLLPWGALLFWPAVSLGIVAAAYYGVGPRIFRKANGRIPLSSRVVLWPCLLGQYFSLLYYRRQCRAWNEIFPGLLIGRRLDEPEARQALRLGVTAVLDLTAEFSEAKSFLKVKYLNIPILDLTSPTQLQLHQMCAFIAEEMENGIVYVHCKIGYSRSSAAVGAYSLASGRAVNVDNALGRLRLARPSIVVRPEVIEGLRQFSSARKEPSRRLVAA